MRAATLFAMTALLLASACSANSSVAQQQSRTDQARADLYQCEGCEGALETDASKLVSHGQMSGPGEPGEAMHINGVVYATDGKTPANGVIIYAYQTNAEGLYAGGSPETEASRRHGRLRAWIKTDAKGRYSFVTIKPAPYPDDAIPAHVHFTILEPGKRPYWIDDIVFEGEFGVTAKYRNSMTKKGGNGIVKAVRDTKGIWNVTRDIILERHPK